MLLVCCIPPLSSTRHEASRHLPRYASGMGHPMAMQRILKSGSERRVSMPLPRLSRFSPQTWRSKVSKQPLDWQEALGRGSGKRL
eukprot:scaffold285_cov304-Pinguiococcus_pyrenoidosus.AAC.22